MAIAQTAKSVFATTDGNGNAHRVSQAEARDWAIAMENNVNGSVYWRETKTELDAIVPAAGLYPGGVVTGDPTAANNGYHVYDYVTPEWVRVRGFPDTLTTLTNVGGTADAITADTEAGVNPADIVALLLTPTATNTGATDITLNSGTTVNVFDPTGSELVGGELVADVPMLLLAYGDDWRIAFPANAVAQTQANVTAAEAAQTAAEAARDLTAGYASDAVSQGNVPIYSTISGMDALSVPAGINAIRVNGFTSAGDGRGGYYVRDDAQPTGEYAALAFRSGDRYLPSGTEDTTNGGWWAWKDRFDMRQVTQRVASKLAIGERVVIACYGDSTTDGNNTTDWVANGRDDDGNALGDTDHVYDAPNAWPMKVVTMLSAFYRDEDYKVMNCGYSGKKICDGWARNNFVTGVVNNCTTFAGGLPYAVIIAFGLNDVTESETDSGWLDDYLSETRALCRLAMSYGIIPILQTCDPSWRSDTDRDNQKSIQMVDTAKAAVAEELGIMLMDTGGDIRRWMSRNKGGFNFYQHQSDQLHGGDAWSGFKGAAVARHFLRDIVERPSNIGQQRVSAHASESRTYLGPNNVYQLIQSKDGACYTTGRSTEQVIPEGFFAQEMWVWNEDPDAELFYMGIGNENVEAADLDLYDRPSFQMYDPANLGWRASRIPQNIGFGASGNGRVCDVPYRLGKLPYGLTRVLHKTGDHPFYFIGHFLIASTPEWQSQALRPSELPTRIYLDALAGIGRYVREFSKENVGTYIETIPMRHDMRNVVGMCGNDRAEIYLRAVMPVGTGIVLGWVPNYSDSDGDRDDISFTMLYRSSSAEYALYLGRRVAGAISYVKLHETNVTLTQTEDAEGALKFLIHQSRPGDTASIRVYEGWDYVAPLGIDYVGASGEVVPSFGYVLGGVYANNGAVASDYFNIKILELFASQETILEVPEPILAAS